MHVLAEKVLLAVILAAVVGFAVVVWQGPGPLKRGAPAAVQVVKPSV